MKRVDQILVELFPELSRSKIQSMIRKQKISVRLNSNGWKPLSRPGHKLEGSDWNRDDFSIEGDDELQYVSRGALKLKAALDHFEVTVEGKICLDVGLSTGGFTDCLLQAGAAKILGVDVGRGQLHKKLRQDSRLVAIDKVNARDPLDPQILREFFSEPVAQTFDIIVVDVSFISLSLIVPSIKNYLSKDGVIVTLVKPQFELTKGDLNKKGVVKDPTLIKVVLEKINGVFEKNGLKPRGYCSSPIEGENGNQEVLMVADKI